MTQRERIVEVYIERFLRRAFNDGTVTTHRDKKRAAELFAARMAPRARQAIMDALNRTYIEPEKDSDFE